MSQNNDVLLNAIMDIMGRLDNIEKHLKIHDDQTWLQIENKKMHIMFIETKHKILSDFGLLNYIDLHSILTVDYDYYAFTDEQDYFNKKKIQDETKKWVSIYLKEFGLTDHEFHLLMNINKDNNCDWYFNSEYRSIYKKLSINAK